MKLRNTFYLILLLFLSCDLDPFPDDSTGGDSVVSNFEVENTSNSGYAPSTVTFKNLSINADSYEWDFGDPTSGISNTSTLASPEHVYINPGIYSVILSVKNSATGLEDSFGMNVIIQNVITFEKTFGETQNNVGWSIIERENGGYAIAGYTSSVGNVESDIYLILTDENGNKLSEKTYGGMDNDYGFSITERQSGGFAIVGNTESFGSGESDIYLILTDANGNEESSKTYGGTSKDVGYTIIERGEGGYAIIGYTESFGNGGQDIYLVLTDANGNELPSSGKTFGGTGDEAGRSIVQTASGDYAIVGYTESFGNGSRDVYLILTDANGNELPSSGKIFGGLEGDEGRSIVQIISGGYAIVGLTQSFGNGGQDIYLILTDANGNELPSSGKTFGGGDFEIGESIIQTKNGGFAIVGLSISFTSSGYPQVYLVLIDESGNELLNSGKVYGDDIEYFGKSIVQTRDGGFAILGNRGPIGGSSTDIYFIKTNANGNL